MKSLVISRADLKANIQEIKRKAESVRIIADLSGGGQGLGVLALANVLKEEGIHSYAVSEVRDAVLLRQSGFEEEKIHMLRSTVDRYELEELIDHNIICTVGSYDAGIALNGIAEERKTIAEVKVKIDTGLGNCGFFPAETDKIINLYKHMSSLAIIGMYTNLSASWKNRKLTESQISSFEAVVSKVQASGYETGPVHVLDSAALFSKNAYPKMDAVCVGSAIIGHVPGRSSFGLLPIGYIEADIEELNWLPKGSKIGYGATQKLRSNTKVGIVSVGWLNGVGLVYEGEAEMVKSFFTRFRKSLPLKTALAPLIRIKNRKVKVLGRVGTGFMILNLSNAECATGDEAIIEVDPRLVKGLPVVYR